MKRLFVILLPVLSLCFGSIESKESTHKILHEANKKCPSEQEGVPGAAGCPGMPGPPGALGPAGPEGPAGPSGEGALSYASGYGDGQILDAPPGDGDPVLFQNIVALQGIIHPVAGNEARFQVLDSGIYLIEWTLTFSNANLMFADIVSVILQNVSAGVSIFPNPIQTTFVPSGGLVTVSGQSLVPLPTNTVIELQIFNGVPPPDGQVLFPSFSITQIAD